MAPQVDDLPHLAPQPAAYPWTTQPPRWTVGDDNPRPGTCRLIDLASYRLSPTEQLLAILPSPVHPIDGGYTVFAARVSKFEDIDVRWTTPELTRYLRSILTEALRPRSKCHARALLGHASWPADGGEHGLDMNPNTVHWTAIPEKPTLNARARLSKSRLELAGTLSTIWKDATIWEGRRSSLA